MKRLAFFVEGYTEVLFVEKLIKEVAGKNNITVEHGFIKGGKTVPKQLTVLNAKNVASGCEYYVLILNCQGDHQVKTRISQEHKSFTNKGYEKIIGIRDVRPTFKHSEISRLKTTMQNGFDSQLIPVEIILSIMEIESLFLGEITHFQKISPAITVAEVKARLGFDLLIDDLELLPEPAADLNNCYAIGGKAYSKGNVQETIGKLDFDYLYLELPQRFNSLSRLVSNIDSFLTTAV